MPTILDRLRGRDIAQKAVVTGNGGTGPGVLAWQNGTSIASTSRNPRRFMKQAQELYHRDLIIRAAEHRVSAAVAGMAWHLADENGDAVDDDYTDPLAQTVRSWLEKPQGALTERKQMTRRALVQMTSRHSGLCGTAFWYQDQRNLLTNLPTVSLYINPARMYPVDDANGVLLGWKLDADEDGNGGIPLELDEVLQFDLEAPDFGHYGIGLVESAWSVAGLTGALERHESTLFTAGARLAGLISPKPGVSLSEDQWQTTVRDWRNITSDPESAKRLHILRGAVDYVRTGATMQELAVESIAKMAREDKLALWGVPESQLPLPAPAGLNSGSTKGFDEAVFYQGAVHDRVLVIQEVIQFQVLDRIAATGGPKLQLVFEEPEFDDQTPLYDRAQKAIDQPLTVNERRQILGLDPLPDVDAKSEPLGVAIWLPSKLTLVAAGPDENGNLVALPEPPPPPPQLVAPPVVEEEEPDVPVKAKTLTALRQRVEVTFVPSTKRDVQTALADQAKAVAARVRARGAALAKKPGHEGIWWDSEREDARMRRAIEGHNLAIAKEVTGEVAKRIPRKGDTFEDTVTDFIKRRTAERVVGINLTTRDVIGKLIADGFAAGLGSAEVADRIETATAFNEARSEMIARTETMLAYNEASLRSFEDFGVTEVEAIDGDDDEECRDRNGKVWPIEESYGILDHPNGTLDWAPVIKAELLPSNPLVDAMKALTEVALRPQPAPVVNITTPDIHVTAPDIHLAPNVTVEAAKATVVPAPIVNVTTPERLRIDALPARKVTRRVNRDAKGAITDTLEVEEDIL